MILAFILLMLVASAFFSGSETAFVTANRLKTEVRARQSGGLGRVVQGFLADPGSLLTTTLVGNNVALVVYSTLVGIWLDEPLTAMYQGFGLATPTGAVLATQTLVATLVVLVFGEVIPKSMMRQPSAGALLLLAGPLRLTYILLWPLIKVAGWTSGLLIRATGTSADSMQQFLRRDFELVIRESRETGTLDLDDEESEILSNVFELRALRVKDSMVPRTDIHAVDETATIADVRRTFVETGHSRLPVYRGSIDRVVGVVLAHDLFHAPESLGAILRPALLVPESKPSRDLLFDFLRGGTSMAVAVDEYGGTAGVITIEDLLEELFGDIRDEHDAAAAPIRRLDERTVLVHGRVELDDLAEATGIRLPEGDYDTVGGCLLARAGHVPAEGETFTLEGVTMTVATATANRIEAVRITTA
ncbi:MAG TPA: hemolysin family protein [Rubricoccaceae bacterium]|jgi:CBS domain containing-hemolysin-like protein